MDPMHYKNIRRSHKGRNIPTASRKLLHALRKQELALERLFAHDIETARIQHRCTAFVMPTIETLTQFRVIPARKGHLCGEPAFERGFCRKHFFSHVLYVRDQDRKGRGLTRRPFAAHQLPVSRMSDVQFDLMADLERLPMDTPYEECIARLNASDPSHPLPLIPARSSRKPRVTK